MTSNESSLWRDRPFLTYWTATAVFSVGAQVTLVAMPLVAVLTLHASATQTGLLRASVALPNLVFGVFAGAWVDRLRRRPLLISSNLAAATFLATIPLAAAIHWLTILQVFAVAFLVGTADLVGLLAANAFLPALIGRGRLVDANSKLASSNATIQIVGPSLGGLLVQLVTAPFAIVAECCLNLVSATVLAAIRRPEPSPVSRPERRLFREIGEGMRTVVNHQYLRQSLIIIGSFNFFSAVAQAVLVLFMARQLGLPPAAIGLIFAATGPGALAGAIAARRVARRVGVGWGIVCGGLLFGLGWAIAPLAPADRTVALPLLMVSQFLLYGGSQVANVNLASVVQAATPDHLLGRVGGTNRLVFQGVVPIGALLGGVVGAEFGLRTALALAAAGSLLAMVYLGFSNLRRIRTTADVMPA